MAAIAEMVDEIACDKKLMGHDIDAIYDCQEPVATEELTTLNSNTLFNTEADDIDTSHDDVSADHGKDKISQAHYDYNCNIIFHIHYYSIE